MSILTLEEQKKTLSSAKKKKRVKLVLGDPIPSIVKTVPEDREIGELVKKSLTGVEDCKKDLVLGVNAIDRKLRTSGLQVLLLAKDVRPIDLISYIITLSSSLQVPTLFVPSLRQLTQDIFGFESIALGVIVKSERWSALCCRASDLCKHLWVKPKETEILDEPMSVGVEICDNHKEKDDSVVEIVHKDNFIPIDHDLKDYNDLVEKKKKLSNTKVEGEYRPPVSWRFFSNPNRKK